MGRSVGEGNGVPWWVRGLTVGARSNGGRPGGGECAAGRPRASWRRMRNHISDKEPVGFPRRGAFPAGSRTSGGRRRPGGSARGALEDPERLRPRARRFAWRGRPAGGTGDTPPRCRWPRPGARRGGGRRNVLAFRQAVASAQARGKTPKARHTPHREKSKRPRRDGRQTKSSIYAPSPADQRHPRAHATRIKRPSRTTEHRPDRKPTTAPGPSRQKSPSARPRGAASAHPRLDPHAPRRRRLGEPTLPRPHALPEQHDRRRGPLAR